MLGFLTRTAISKPSALIASNYTGLPAYEEACSKLGYYPDDLHGLKLKQFLFENEIPLYDYDHVIKYLGHIAADDETHICWKALRGSDGCSYLQLRSPYGDRLVQKKQSGIYKKIVPLRVLETISLIQGSYPDAKFYVSELVNFPDPFAAVSITEGTLHVFACWDEPGFSG